ncbi:cytochrome P450 [Byssothecium circinans]|uniref:Cytochrome P450 n=1 Tax=Byssothecium circinans TaxID=147558 RepID=A0A6A5TK80_9PLEO|nr:cytochrome P450 [Byssothecium circinans]
MIQRRWIKHNLQLELSVAAIHTTTFALTHLLYDTAAHPKYIPILRDEIKTALAQKGGEYNKDCISKMVKLDSFMKESQRLHPPGFANFQRLVLKTFTLSDGTVIPKGVTLNIDGWSRYRDAENWANPDQFDGLRFVRLREQSQDRGNHQYVSSNSDDVFWGQGRHACPGRFFAANEIKTLFAMFLLEYDIMFPKGTERPADTSAGAFICPSPTAQVLGRKVQK